MPRLSNLKPFVPSGEDFNLARDFFMILGFKENWTNDEHGICEMQCDDTVFLLQRYHNQEMQDNLMMSIDVDDLDAWWKHIEDSGALAMPGVRAKPPEEYPWGQREIHLVDPAGVFWHFVQKS